jgi:hypothetical protein
MKPGSAISNLEADALYWLGLAKLVLAGEISPDEALQTLNLDRSRSESFETANDN